MTAPADRWQFWIDRGGTFTDIVARDMRGMLHCAKLLSANPGRYADAAVEGVRRVLGAGAGALVHVSAIGADTEALKKAAPASPLASDGSPSVPVAAGRDGAAGDEGVVAVEEDGRAGGWWHGLLQKSSAEIRIICGKPNVLQSQHTTRSISPDACACVFIS